jgi:hypothetical protein
MRKGFYCPSCGLQGLKNLFITTHKGKSLSLLLSSQADIRKSSGKVNCIICKQVSNISKFYKTANGVGLPKVAAGKEAE